MAKREKFTKIDELSGDAIDHMPEDFDFGSGYSETWESTEAVRCDKCDEIVIGGGGDKHKDTDSDSECEGYLPEASGPMMNYRYPLPSFRNGGPTEAAKAIVDLPLCIVEEMEEGSGTGNYFLALTGGGMDLSWEICEAYMRLGFIPPLHYADVPKMCGRGDSAKDRWIIRGCIASADVMVKRAERVKERIKDTAKWAQARRTVKK